MQFWSRTKSATFFLKTDPTLKTAFRSSKLKTCLKSCHTFTSQNLSTLIRTTATFSVSIRDRPTSFVFNVTQSCLKYIAVRRKINILPGIYLSVSEDLSTEREFAISFVWQCSRALSAKVGVAWILRWTLATRSDCRRSRRRLPWNRASTSASEECDRPVMTLWLLCPRGQWWKNWRSVMSRLLFIFSVEAVVGVVSQAMQLQCANAPGF